MSSFIGMLYCATVPVTRFIQMIQYIIALSLLPISIHVLKEQVKKATPEAHFCLYSNETIPIHLYWHYPCAGWCRHTFFGSVMMPLNLYSLFPFALFVPCTQKCTHSVSLYISLVCEHWKECARCSSKDNACARPVCQCWCWRHRRPRWWKGIVKMHDVLNKKRHAGTSGAIKDEEEFICTI